MADLILLDSTIDYTFCCFLVELLEEGYYQYVNQKTEGEKTKHISITKTINDCCMNEIIQMN
jgi:hypothetical protein